MSDGEGWGEGLALSEGFMVGGCSVGSSSEVGWDRVSLQGRGWRMVVEAV